MKTLSEPFLQAIGTEPLLSRVSRFPIRTCRRRMTGTRFSADSTSNRPPFAARMPGNGALVADAAELSSNVGAVAPGIGSKPADAPGITTAIGGIFPGNETLISGTGALISDTGGIISDTGAIRMSHIDSFSRVGLQEAGNCEAGQPRCQGKPGPRLPGSALGGGAGAPRTLLLRDTRPVYQVAHNSTRGGARVPPSAFVPHEGVGLPTGTNFTTRPFDRPALVPCGTTSDACVPRDLRHSPSTTPDPHHHP